MDIIIYIGMIVLIGAFFFIDKYMTTQNSMFVIILLTFIGFIMVQNTTIDIVEYGQYVPLENTTGIYVTKTIDITQSGMGLLNTQSFMVLVFGFFFMLSTVNLFMGKDIKRD